MPARFIFTLIAVVVLVPVGVQAQTVTVKGSVSKIVALSVAPDSDIGASVVSNGSTVRLTLSSADVNSPEIHIPLLVRSNSSFKISAAFDSTTAELTQILVTDVHSTGNLVSRNALDIVRQSRPDISQPLFVLSGPRVSLGGTLQSPNNALRVTLLIRVKPEQPLREWLAHLTLVATPE
jgi:hypothetical protein